MNLILVEPHEIDAEGRVVLTDVRAEHVLKVLRAEVGTALRAGIVNGGMGLAEVVRVGDRDVVLDCRGLRDAPVPERARVDLVLALPRPKVLARLYAPLACLGVGRVMLTNAARVERYYFDSHAIEPVFVRKRLLHGLEQARDTRLPEVSVHRSFRKLLEDELDGLSPGSRRLAADLGDATDSVRVALADLRTDERVLVAVGPEGGWVEFERSRFAEMGFRGVSLGTRALYSDLACLLLIGAVSEALT